MIADQEFLIWAQAWCVHDHMLRTCFMVKPFVLDPSSAAYEKQFEKCKLNQALLGSRPSSCDSPCQGSHLPDSSSSTLDNQSVANTLPTSPRYLPYPKSPPTSFCPSDESSSLCVRCGHKGHCASNCSATQASQPKRPLLITWKNGHLETTDSKHICLLFNVHACSTCN